MCGEDNLNSTNGLRLDKPKLNILPQNLQNWKKTFLANAEIAMEPSKAVKEYKEELIKHFFTPIFLFSLTCSK
jgi:hypothetical protein